MIVRHRYAADPESIMEARQFILAQLPDAANEVRDAVSLMVSELATNAVLHARTEFDVCVEVTEEWLRVEVIDRGSGMPHRQPKPPPTAEHGRGLRIVSELSDRWGVDGTEGQPGKTVWFQIAAAPQGSP
jgi:anti-sigma regulatory factor (Ser/Thr protein kinase)